MLTQEFIAGSVIVAAGCLFLYLQQCEWYRNMMFSSYWKQYNTPSGRIIANVQCGAVVVMGLAMCFGFVEFGK